MPLSPHCESRCADARDDSPAESADDADVRRPTRADADETPRVGFCADSIRARDGTVRRRARIVVVIGNERRR